MKEHVLAVVLAWITIASAAAEDTPTVTFAGKYFTDLGNIVAVEGSLAREGASPDDTHRTVLWCYQEHRECLEFMISDSNYVIEISPGVPIIYTVKVWAPDRIVAEFDLACGAHETWLLDRLRKTAEVFVDGSCDDIVSPSHRTIEDPPSWTKLKELIKEREQHHR